MNPFIRSTTNEYSIPEQKGSIYQARKWVLAIITGLAPAVVTFGLINGYLQRTLYNFRPTIWNDQVYYWHQILTFSQNGFNGGYYMFNEKLPSISFFHFGASGFLYPTLYGMVARVVGWEPYTGILLNMASIAIAIWILIYVARFDQLQIILTGLLTFAVSPILFFIPTIFQESFHHSAAFIVAALFYKLLKQNGDISRRFVFAGICFLIVISMVRFSWILLTLPFFLLSFKKLTLQSLLFAFVASGVLMISVLLIFQNTSAPGNNSVFGIIGEFGASVDSGLRRAWDAILLNIKDAFTVTDLRKFPLEFVQFFVLLFCLLLSGRQFLNEQLVKIPKQLYFHLYSLTSILGASLVFYLGGGYYRVFAPYVILSGVLLIALRNFRLAGILIVIGLLGTGVSLTTYQELDANFAQYSPAQVDNIKTPLEQYLTYDSQTANPWCNTLVTNAKFLNLTATFIPAGIGISIFLDPARQPTPLKSNYVLLDNYSYAILQDGLHLDFLASINGARLYRNLDADCP